MDSTKMTKSLLLMTTGLIVALTGFGSLSQSAAAQAEPAASDRQGEKRYITPECQITQTNSADYYRLNQQRFSLKIDGGDYQLYSGIYMDGAPIVCLAMNDLSDPQVIQVPKLDFLDRLIRDPKKPNAFVLISREGNGMDIPVNHWGLQFTTTEPTITDLKILKQSGKITQGQNAIHRFNAKAGQSIAIVLDSRARAEFVVLNDKGAKVIAGKRNSVEKGISATNVAIPASGAYQVVVSHPEGSPASYALSINSDQIP
jgi:hypothetical protein